VNRMHGYKGQVSADKTGGATVVPIASLNSWTLDNKRDVVDVSAFQDVNHVYVTGIMDAKGTLGGWYDADDPTLFDIAMGTVACSLELNPNTTLVAPALHKWTGKAWLDASIDVKSSGAITITSTWVAAGAWTKT